MICHELSSGKLRISVSAIRQLHSTLRCVENILDTRKETLLWLLAYQIRWKTLDVVMMMTKRMNADNQAAGAAGEDMAKAQALLIEREQMKKLSEDTMYYAIRATQELNISTAHMLYRDLKSSGMQMADPMVEVNASNLTSRRTGVWETTIDDRRDGGEFLIVRWVTEKEPMFSLSGYGSVRPGIRIEDPAFDETGVFSDNCSINITLADGRLTYKCQDYVKGETTDKIVAEMKKLVQTAMSKRT